MSHTVGQRVVKGIAKTQGTIAMRTVLDTLKLTEIFINCMVPHRDDFCQPFQLHCLQAGYEKEVQPRQMHKSEIMTIFIYYPGGEPHYSGMKCFNRGVGRYSYEQIIRKTLRSYWKHPYLLLRWARPVVVSAGCSVPLFIF
jgi:hypothetical protein